MSRREQMQHSVHKPWLLDHLVGLRQQRSRQVETENLRGLQIDDQFKMHRLFDRQLGGLRAFNNAIHKESSAARELWRSRLIGHQATVLNLLAKDEHGW